MESGFRKLRFDRMALNRSKVMLSATLGRRSSSESSEVHQQWSSFVGLRAPMRNLAPRKTRISDTVTGVSTSVGDR